MNNKRIQLYVLIVQCLFTAFVVGVLTNWFRYGMCLIRTILFLLYLATAGALLIPTHIFCLKAKAQKKSLSSSNRACVIATLVLILVSLGTHKSIFESFVPPTKKHVTHTLHRTFMNHDGEEIQYWVEFKNPFHQTHTEYLVLAQGDQQNRIQIVAKQDDGPFSHGTNTDRIELQESNFLLVTEFEPWIDRYFLINPESMNVISNWVINTKPDK